MITRETDYAVRTILYLCGQDKDRYVSSNELSEKMCIPYRFLRKLIKKLVDSGIVKSKKGKNGGLVIAKKPEEITLYEVMSVLDVNGITLNSCLRDEEKCSFSGVCPVHGRLLKIQDELDRKLSEISFDSLM